MANYVGELEHGHIPSAPIISTMGIGFLSGLWGPISIVVGIGEVIAGYYMYKKHSKWGSPVLAGGIIATFMGLGETMWGAMSVNGYTTTSSLVGGWKIMWPAAYGMEWVSKIFAPKVPSFVPTPETVVQTGLRTVW